MKKHLSITLFSVSAAILCGCANRTQETVCGDIHTITQSRGARLSYCEGSGLRTISCGGLLFKDHNRNGKLDSFEDWRLGAEERAAGLAALLPVEALCGLMINSAAIDIPEDSTALLQRHKGWIDNDHIRATLVKRNGNPLRSAIYTNLAQRECEGCDFAIPHIFSSDPRNEVRSYEEFSNTEGSKRSLWPVQLALGATFDGEVVRKYGEITAAEFRAQGITMFLGPQADVASDPRWARITGAFSEDVDLVTDLSRICIDAYQTTPGAKDGWGGRSVACMVKHWPGGGPCEAGRDAHLAAGKYAVYPGDGQLNGINPFVNGAFRLEGGTSHASCVMAYYTIPYGIAPESENVGNAFNSYVLTDLLKEKYGYQGYISTDWNVMPPYKGLQDNPASGRCWGMEDATQEERFLKMIEAGIDQMAIGNLSAEYVRGAYRQYAEKYGEKAARERFEHSARKVLEVTFRLGLFECPYVDEQEADRIVGCPEFCREGHLAQLKSVVMLKNRAGVLPLKPGSKVYIPQADMPGIYSLITGLKRRDGRFTYCLPPAEVGDFFSFTDNPDKADFAMVFTTEPVTGTGFSAEDYNSGGNGYMPLSLQYPAYTASAAREHSIAGGDPCDRTTDRSYRGKTITPPNSNIPQLMEQTRELMGDKPVVLLLMASRPVVMRDIEPYADAILLAFNIERRCFLEIASGQFEPYGLLPVQFPADMDTVEEQFEDTPRDMRCHVDSEGNTYDFAFGMDWNGVIDDKRVRKYR